MDIKRAAKVPNRFLIDHLERCAESQPVVTVVSWGARISMAIGGDAEWSNLKDDAEYYANGSDYAPLIRPARTMLVALARHGI